MICHRMNIDPTDEDVKVVLMKKTNIIKGRRILMFPAIDAIVLLIIFIALFIGDILLLSNIPIHMIIGENVLPF